MSFASRGAVCLLTLVPAIVAAQPDPAPEPAPPEPVAPAPPPEPAPPVETPTPAPAPAPAPTPTSVMPVPEPEPPKAAPAASPLVPAWEAKRLAARPLDPKITFRPGKGITLHSADDDFEVAIKVRGQILSTVEAEHTDDETLSGTQIRRARLALQGHMFGDHNKYKMEIAISPRDSATRRGTVTTAPLLDWYMTFDYSKLATLVAGQYKVPFSRQRVVSSGSLQMVDRSIVQGEFNLDRNVGFDLRSTALLDRRLHYYLGFYAGEGRNAFELRSQNLVYLARVELQPFGKFQDYVEADFERTKPRVALGLSYAYDKDSVRDQGPLGSAPDDGGLTSFHAVEADFLVKAYGLSVTGELFWRDGKREGGGAVDEMGAPLPVEAPRDGMGFFAQAGYLLPRSSFELSARYGAIHPSSGPTTLSDRRELGSGVSYYFAHHAFKLQADYFHLWEAGAIGDGADVVRLQLEAGL